MSLGVKPVASQDPSVIRVDFLSSEGSSVCGQQQRGPSPGRMSRGWLWRRLRDCDG